MKQSEIVLLQSIVVLFLSGCGHGPHVRSDSPGTRVQSRGIEVDGYEGMVVSEAPNGCALRFARSGRQITIGYQDPHQGGALMVARRVGDEWVFVERHINPRLATGILCDLRSKKAFVYYGTFFAVDDRSRKVACWLSPQTSDANEPGQLIVAGRLSLTLSGHDVKEIHWDASGALVLLLDDGTILQVEADLPGACGNSAR